MKKTRWLVGLVLASAVVVGTWWVCVDSPADSTTGPNAADLSGPTQFFISGRVVDTTGEPIAGARVGVSAAGESATTGDRGQFHLSGLDAGTHRLRARAGGFVAGGPPEMRRLEVVISRPTRPGRQGAAGVSDIDVVLRRAAAVRGRVVAAGKPVGGAKIGVYYVSARGMSGELDPYVVDEAATTDARGAFELDALAPGRLQILVEADDYALAQSPQFRLEPGTSHGPVVIDLAPSATVIGRVTDTGGRPLQADVVLRGAAMSRSRRVQAGADGRYVFRRVPAGSVDVVARAAGFRTDRSDSLETPAGETTEHDIVMESASGIFGRVGRPDGSPAGDARVILRPDRGRAKVLRVDDDGRFGWDSPRQSTYTATAVSPHFGASTPRSVSAGTAADLELNSGGAVRGRVVGPDGGAVQSFKIGVASFEVDGPRPYSSKSIGVQQIHDSGGRFRIDSLRPGAYWFQVNTTRFSSAKSSRVTVAAGQTNAGIIIRVGRAGRIVGQVTNSDDGTAVGGARVAVFTPNSPFSSKTTRTDEAGRFELAGVPPGRRSLRVTKKGYLATVAAGVSVSAQRASRRDVAIRPKKPGERMQFQGIGAMLGKTDQGVVVRKVFDGKPASQYGLKHGDVIREVDGQPVEALPLSGVIEQIRGRGGVPVELTIDRDGQGRQTLNIERGQVVVKH